MTRLFLSCLLGAAALTLGFALTPSPAEACGGFFCSRSPVDQSGEAIVYAKEPDGTLTMSVRIQYEGDDDAFAWILPAPVPPTISVGTEAIFTALDQRTRQQFDISEFRTEGTCRTPPTCYDTMSGEVCGSGDWYAETDDGYYPGPAFDAAAAADASAGGPVTVYSQGPVGPFETVVLGATSAADVLEWLGDNGYDLPAESEEPLQAYADAGHVFVALKLATSATSRFIQPITLTMETDEVGCLPLRLTRIAATTDMPITTYFLGGERVVPSNYSMVRVDVENIPGLWTGERRWSGEVGAVVDTVGGQGFVTEYAGDTPEGISLTLPSVADLATESDPARFLMELQVRGFSGTASLLAALEAFMPPPVGQEAQDYYNCLTFGSVASCGAPTSFDPAGLAAHLQESEVDPRNAMQALVDRHTYLTRMTTAMDPDEMTVDPLFMVDGSMPDVSNVHEAAEVRRCSADYYENQAPLDLVIGDTAHRTYEGVPASDRAWCSSRWGSHCAELADLPPAARDRALGEDDGLCTVGRVGGSRSAGVVGFGLLLAALVLVRRRR